MSIKSIAQEAIEEVERAEEKFAGFNSSHEGYAVLLEEVDELWDVVKLNPKKVEVPKQFYSAGRSREYIKQWQENERKKMMRAEAIQVAAMAIRFIKCVCDEDIEDKS